MPDTILIVDDEIDLLLGLERTIRMEMDCRVLTADNGKEALSIIRRESTDVALVDIRMPEMDGISLLQHVHAFDPAITVIVMTAWGSVDGADEAMRNGARDYVEKPWDNARLIATVRTQVELGQALRRSHRLEVENRMLRREGLPEMIAESPARRNACRRSA